MFFSCKEEVAFAIAYASGGLPRLVLLRKPSRGKRGAQPPTPGLPKQLQSSLDWDAGSDAPQSGFRLPLMLSGVESGAAPSGPQGLWLHPYPTGVPVCLSPGAKPAYAVSLALARGMGMEG